MFKVASRNDLVAINGRASAKPEPVAPAPAAPPVAEPSQHLVQMQAAATAMADAATIMAAASAAAARPRTLKATIIRDDKQRMKEVIINVI